MSKTVSLVYFSPAGTTERMSKTLLKGVADTLKYEIKQKITLLHPEDRAKSYKFGKDDILVMGLPVYEGRVPEIAVDTMKNMKGDGTLTVIAMVYGNRDFEDSLLEMKNILQENGFTVLSAAAFIGEHAFTHSVATGRPNKDDLALINDFAVKSARKIQDVINGAEAVPVQVSGNFPYKEPLLGVSGVAPVTTDACTECMICVDRCPTRAISAANPKESDASKCILCNACIRVCPEKARHFEVERIEKVTRWLERKFTDHKAPTIFL